MKGGQMYETPNQTTNHFTTCLSPYLGHILPDVSGRICGGEDHSFKRKGKGRTDNQFSPHAGHYGKRVFNQKKILMRYPAEYLKWLISHYTERLNQERAKGNYPAVKFLKEQLFNFKRIV